MLMHACIYRDMICIIIRTNCADLYVDIQCAMHLYEDLKPSSTTPEHGSGRSRYMGPMMDR